VATGDAFVLRLKITNVAKTDTGYVAIGQVLRVIQSPDPQVHGSGFEVWLGMPPGVTAPVKESECTYTLMRRHSGGNVWNYGFPNDNPTGHVIRCLLPGDPRPTVIRNDYLSQQTAQLFWNSVMDDRLDQAMAVVDTPFAWGIDPVDGRADLRKRLESPEFKAVVAGMRGKQVENVLVPDDELPKVLKQKFNLTDTNRIAVVAWVLDGKARILVAVGAASAHGQMMGHRGERTCVAPQSKLPDTLGVVWQSPVPNWGLASPVVVKDRVFAVSEPDRDHDFPVLVCRNAADGTLLWQREIPHEVDDVTRKAWHEHLVALRSMAGRTTAARCW
jgi:hypothetical protein